MEPVIQLISWAFTGTGVIIIVLSTGAGAVLVHTTVNIALRADTTLRCVIPDLNSWTLAVSCGWIVDQPRTTVASASLQVKNFLVVGALQIARTLAPFLIQHKGLIALPITDALTPLVVKAIAIGACLQSTLALALPLIQSIRVVTLLIADALTTLVIKPIVSGARFQATRALTFLLIQHVTVLTLPVTDAPTATIVKAL